MRTIATTALLLALAACDTDEPAAPAPDKDEKIGAANLLTPEEVGQALGEPVGPAETQLDRDRLTQAAWNTRDGRRSVSLMARTGRVAGQDGEATRASLKEAGAALEDVPGLGRDAFWSSGMLHVYDDRGNAFILTFPEGPEAKSKAVELMRKALARVSR